MEGDLLYQFLSVLARYSAYIENRRQIKKIITFGTPCMIICKMIRTKIKNFRELNEIRENKTLAIISLFTAFIFKQIIMNRRSCKKSFEFPSYLHIFPLVLKWNFEFVGPSPNINIFQKYLEYVTFIPNSTKWRNNFKLFTFKDQPSVHVNLYQRFRNPLSRNLYPAPPTHGY